jgi:hypothetical protein
MRPAPLSVDSGPDCGLPRQFYPDFSHESRALRSRISPLQGLPAAPQMPSRSTTCPSPNVHAGVCQLGLVYAHVLLCGIGDQGESHAHPAYNTAAEASACLRRQRRWRRATISQRLASNATVLRRGRPDSNLPTHVIATTILPPCVLQASDTRVQGRCRTSRLLSPGRGDLPSHRCRTV